MLPQPSPQFRNSQYCQTSKFHLVQTSDLLHPSQGLPTGHRLLKLTRYPLCRVVCSSMVLRRLVSFCITCGGRSQFAHRVHEVERVVGFVCSSVIRLLVRLLRSATINSPASRSAAPSACVVIAAIVPESWPSSSGFPGRRLRLSRLHGDSLPSLAPSNSVPIAAFSHYDCHPPHAIVEHLVGHSARNPFRGPSGKVYVVERFNPVDKSCIGDPATCDKPWTSDTAWSRLEGSIDELSCNEWNYGLRNILQGALVAEATAAKKATSK
jgi:hypothetical protein